MRERRSKKADDDKRRISSNGSDPTNETGTMIRPPLTDSSTRITTQRQSGPNASIELGNAATATRPEPNMDEQDGRHSRVTITDNESHRFSSVWSNSTKFSVTAQLLWFSYPINKVRTASPSRVQSWNHALCPGRKIAFSRILLHYLVVKIFRVRLIKRNWIVAQIVLPCTIPSGWE